MKKRILIGALAASSLFLGALTACDDASSKPINTTSVKETTSIKETTSNSINDELLKKVYNEIKNSYTDTTYENFENLNVETAPDTLKDACSIKLYYAGKLIAVAEACYLNMPELAHEEENGSRDFTFVCGGIDYKVFDNSQIGMKI